MTGSSAVLSPDGRYRYVLRRRWWESGPPLLFVMLNPSTADAERDDATIRRCVGYAKALGFNALTVGNLYAWRATDPRELPDAALATGSDNDAHLRDLANAAGMIICAWGANKRAAGRDRRVFDLLTGMAGIPARHRRQAWCLGVTKDGAPRHPVRLPKRTRIVQYRGPR